MSIVQRGLVQAGCKGGRYTYAAAAFWQMRNIVVEVGGKRAFVLVRDDATLVELEAQVGLDLSCLGAFLASDEDVRALHDGDVLRAGTSAPVRT